MYSLICAQSLGLIFVSPLIIPGIEKADVNGNIRRVYQTSVPPICGESSEPEECAKDGAVVLMDTWL
jgi:hypothetical protein